jgi:hypothetical protein
MAEDAPEWPTEADCGLADYYDYLEMEGASEQTLRALDTAFREYTFLDALAEAEYEAA